MSLISPLSPEMEIKLAFSQFNDAALAKLEQGLGFDPKYHEDKTK